MYDGFAGCEALLAAAAAGAAAGTVAFGFGAEVLFSSSTVLRVLPRLRRRSTTTRTTMPTRSRAPMTESATVAATGKPLDSLMQSAWRPVQL